MPICIECSYPVPQLFHVLHSSSKTQKSHAPPPPSIPHPDSPPTTNPGPTTLSSKYSVPSVSSTSTAQAQQAQQVKPVTSLNSKSGFSNPNQIPARGAKGFGEVRLTQCPRCKRFADKYVEHDFVVLFIDLVLVKPQVSLEVRICV